MSDHDRIAALLPWYANGSLDADERAAVERHVEGCPSCSALLEQARGQSNFVRIARETRGDHIEPSLLTRFVEAPESLEPEARDRIEATLASCRTCREARDLLLDVGARLEQAESARDRAGSAVRPSLWDRLAATLLRPAPALAYLLALVILAPALLVSLRGKNVPIGAPAAVVRTTGESALRDVDGDTIETAPLRLSADGPTLLILETGLAPTDLERLGFEIELVRGERLLWSRPTSGQEFVVDDGQVRLPLMLRTDRLRHSVDHQVILRVRRDGDALDGQPLFRRHLQVAR